MDRRTVLTKTAKGLMEVTGKTSLLPRDLRNVLSQVDGKATVGDLNQKLDRYSETKLIDALGRLVRDGFVREFVSAPSSVSPPSQVPIVHEDVDLDFTALISTQSSKGVPSKAETTAQNKAEADEVSRQVAEARSLRAAGAKTDTDAKAKAEAAAKAQAETRAKQEAEERAKREAAEKVKREAEEKAKREAADKARREGEERAKREAAEQAAREAAERAKREAEEKAKHEAADKARREAEERARKEAAARTKREAEEKAKREAEEKAKREGAETAKRDAEEKAKREAAEKAKRVAEEKAQHEAQQKARHELEERARRDAAELARREAEEKAQREAAEKAKRAAEEQARREAEQRAHKEAEARARREAEERAQRERAEQARREAEEKAKREVEAKAKREAAEKARRDTEEKARRESEERARREAEERARRDAAERAQREAQERARAEEEARIRHEMEERVRRTEERARREAEERAKRESTERAAREAEERAAREEEARARREAEARERRAAEEQARHEAEARALRAATAQAEQEAAEAAQRVEHEELDRRDDEKRVRDGEKARAKADAEAAARARRDERAREKAESDAHAAAKQKTQDKEAAGVAARLDKIRRGKKRSIGKYLGIAAGLAAIAGVVYLHVMPVDLAQYENTASSRLGTPVKIGAGNFSLWPSPSIRFENVRVGAGDGVRIATATAKPDFLSLLSEQPQLSSIELHGVTVDAAGLASLLFNRPRAGAFGLQRIHATGVKLVLPKVTLPELEARANLQYDGALQMLTLSTSDKMLTAELAPQQGERAAIEITVNNPTQFFGLPFPVEAISAKGVVTATELDAAQLDARLFDGIARGKGQLRWNGPFALDASFELKQVDAKRIAPMLTGRLHGSGAVAASGEALDKLAATARVDGNFAVQKGQIAGVDLARTLQTGKSVAGSTNFNELSVQAQFDKGRLVLRTVKLDAGNISASGAVEVDGGKSLAGKVAADMKTPGGALRATLTLSGTPSQLNIKR